ncbi:nucleoside-diphosphate kinase [Candidatus Marsarchaeota archaeon]|nr:nucleoside-diphosphate kinase [Candidatus Marsarchaeota archaeon]
MERALVLIKPDGIERALIGNVISKFEISGLKVVGIKMLNATKEMAGKHYAEDEEWLTSVGKKMKASYKEKGEEITEPDRAIGMRVREMLMNELIRVPIIAMVLEGNAANDVARKIAGSTEPRKADPSTIRGMYSSDTYGLADKQKRPVRNIVHVSESKEAAEKEIKVWFKESEIYKYKRADEGAMY